MDKPLNDVEIRFKGIYLLNSFYIGLYFGGQEINKADIIKNEKVPLDLSHLAKMAVFKKEDQQSPVTFGVYEHESEVYKSKQGWANSSLQSPKFELGTWYHIKMQLNGTNLSVKVWAEPNLEPTAWQSFPVSASPAQKVVGIISSGASVEYQFITPGVMIQSNSKMRPDIVKGKGSRCELPCDFASPKWVDFYTEQSREDIARSQLKYLVTPTVGLHTLNSVGKTQILRGQYIYTTKGTNLTLNNKVVDDYVIPCQVNDVGGSSVIVDKSVGQPPTEDSSLVSLVSESVYTKDMNSLSMKLSNIFTTYVAQYGPLDDALEKQITTLRQSYAAQGMLFTFGSFKLQAVSQQELEQQHFIYTVSPLKDTKGDVIKDDKGKELSDYFLIATLDDVNLSNYSSVGISYNDMLSGKSNKYGIISLVSGDLFGSAAATRINNFSPSYLLSHYVKNLKDYSPLSQNLNDAIVAAQTIYKAYVTVDESKATPDTGPAVQPTKLTDLAPKKVNEGTGVQEPGQNPADKSVQQRADDAAGGEQPVFGGPP